METSLFSTGGKSRNVVGKYGYLSLSATCGQLVVLTLHNDVIDRLTNMAFCGLWMEGGCRDGLFILNIVHLVLRLQNKYCSMQPLRCGLLVTFK